MGEFSRNRGELMPEVIVRKGEPVDRALKRLKSKLDAEGILDEVRRLRAFETPNQKSRRKAKANAKRGRTKFRFNPNGKRARALCGAQASGLCSKLISKTRRRAAFFVL